MDGFRLFAGLPLLVLVAVAAAEAAWLTRRGVRYDWRARPPARSGPSGSLPCVV